MKRFFAAIRLLLIQLLIFCCLISLVILAIEARCCYKYAKLPPNDNRTVTWGKKIEKNSFGFREREFSPASLAVSGDFVIVVLGDSLTEGVGLSEEQRYSNLLEGLLRREYVGRKITVLNFGMMAAPTTQERDIFRSFYKEIRPSLVIVGFCSNDPLEKERGYSKEREVYFTKISGLLEFLRTHRMPGTARLISDVYENILIHLKKIPDYDDILNAAYDEKSSDWMNFAAALKDIAVMSKAVSPNPPIFISLNQGVSNNRPTDYANPDMDLKRRLELFHQAERSAAQAGFISVNCEEEFKKLKNHVMAVVPGEDGHPTAEMNKIYAEKLFSVIKANRFLER